MDNVIILTGEEGRVRREAMKRVILEYAEGLRKNDPLVNPDHLDMDMRTAARQAVQALKENEQTLGRAG